MTAAPDAVRPADALGRYLRSHYSLSRGTVELFRRSAKGQSDPTVREQLGVLAAEVAEDRAALLAIMVGLGVDRSPWQERAVVAAERVGRRKPNGSLLKRSRLSDFLELEAMTIAVQATWLTWRALRDLADADRRLDVDHLDRLMARAEDQLDRLVRLRSSQAADVLLPGHTVEDRP